jgi:hypothetical protein
MDTQSIPNLNPCSNYDITIPPYNVVVPVTGTETIAPQDNEISIYPNPARDLVQVSNLPAQAELIALYAVTGERVGIRPTLGRSKANVDVSGLPAGVYILTVMGSQYSVNRKVVVVR